MGERGGAAALATVLALVGVVLLVGGIRGTWLDVWHALANTTPKSSSAAQGEQPGPREDAPPPVDNQVQVEQRAATATTSSQGATVGGSRSTRVM